MAMFIIHRLEVVNIENDQVKKLIVPASIGEFLVESVEEIAFVVDSSQSVGDRGIIKTLLDLLHFHV